MHQVTAKDQIPAGTHDQAVPAKQTKQSEAAPFPSAPYLTRHSFCAAGTAAYHASPCAHVKGARRVLSECLRQRRTRGAAPSSRSAPHHRPGPRCCCQTHSPASSRCSCTAPAPHAQTQQGLMQNLPVTSRHAPQTRARSKRSQRESPSQGRQGASTATLAFRHVLTQGGRAAPAPAAP